MLATAPIAPGTLPQPIYARRGREYAQQLADGRITLGGFSDLDDGSWCDREDLSPVVQERLTSYLRDDLAVDAPVTHRWVGLVGYGPEALPTCGPVPGSDGRVLALGGYNGTGHVQGFVAGRIVAERVATGGGEDVDLYVAPDVSLLL
jgi:gamma-glutamylputrescine oxidase